MKTEPLVLCLTNTVAANFTANAVLAVGARPAMIEDPSEAAELAAIADALLVNVGTVSQAQAEVQRAAIAGACAKGVPWVLDPVAVHVLTFRRALVREFLASKPTLVRGNREEIAFLEKEFALRPTADGIAAVLATGEKDLLRVAEPSSSEEISGGVSLLQCVTATGCAQGALGAAFLGAGYRPADAARTVSRLMKRAGERAFARVQTPGGFQTALLDALYELSPLRGGVL